MITKPVTLEIEGLKITGELYLPGEGTQTPYPAVCICHGMPSGNHPDPGDGGYPRLAEEICRDGFAVFIFNFRGAGTSGGNLDMLGWTRDLQAVIDYLCALPEVDRAHLSLLGFSAGAAVSVFVASQDKRVSSVVTCACPAEFTFFSEADNLSSIVNRFRSIGAIKEKDFPRSTEDWLSGFRLINPIRHVAGIAPRPLLLVHGNRDETVDVSHAYELHDRAGEPKQLTIIDGAGHRLRQDGRVMPIVRDWLKSQRAR